MGFVGSGRPPKVLNLQIGWKSSEAGSSRQTAGGRESVEDMLQRLNLTSKEDDPLILKDEGDGDLPCPEWALVGKVLAPNPLHTSVRLGLWCGRHGVIPRIL
jgi:hypothetical protein